MLKLAITTHQIATVLRGNPGATVREIGYEIFGHDPVQRQSAIITKTLQRMYMCSLVTSETRRGVGRYCLTSYGMDHYFGVTA